VSDPSCRWVRAGAISKSAVGRSGPTSSGREAMRVMIKFAIPIDDGNEGNRTGKLQKVFQQLAEDLKPEAGYFFPEGGQRAGFFIVDMRESSQVAEIASASFTG
jgi:hypothetical protein